MELRRARPDDAVDIARVQVAAWRGAYAGLMPDAFLQELSVEKQTSKWQGLLAGEASHRPWLAWQGSELAGWAFAGASRDDDAGANTAELWALNVTPSFWRNGVGRALMAKVEPALVRETYEACTLWVLEGNARARHFYEALGFEGESGVKHDREFGEVKLHELRMRKTLRSGGATD